MDVKKCPAPGVAAPAPAQSSFGENYCASNYGVVYSAKVPSSLVGIGVGASVIHAMGWSAAYLIGAVFGLASVALALPLRQPQETPAPESERARRVRTSRGCGRDCSSGLGLSLRR